MGGFLHSGLIHAGSITEVYYQGLLAPANITPTFDKGYLIVYNPERSISVYGPDGLPRFTAGAQVTGATFIHIESAAADDAGTIVAAIRHQIPLGEHGLRDGGGLAFFDAKGKQTRFVDTGRYRPTQVAFADDRSVWATGYQAKQGTSEPPDYFLLHKYSFEGQETGAFLPRSSFDPNFEPNWVTSECGVCALATTG